MKYLVENESDFTKTIEAIELITSDFKLLGTYKKGQHHED